MRVGGVTSRIPGHAVGGQRPPERQPADAFLGGGHVDAKDPPVALGVDLQRRSTHARRPHVRRHEPRAPRSGRQRSVGPAFSGRVRNASTAVSRFVTDTCDSTGGWPEVRTSLSVRRVRAPSRWQVAATRVRARSARLRRFRPQSERWELRPSMGIVTPNEPVRVATRRCRYPLRDLVAQRCARRIRPLGASVSAPVNVSMSVASSSRNTSGWHVVSPFRK